MLIDGLDIVGGKRTIHSLVVLTNASFLLICKSLDQLSVSTRPTKHRVLLGVYLRANHLLMLALEMIHSFGEGVMLHIKLPCLVTIARNERFTL